MENATIRMPPSTGLSFIPEANIPIEPEYEKCRQDIEVRTDVLTTSRDTN